MAFYPAQPKQHPCIGDSLLFASSAPCSACPRDGPPVVWTGGGKRQDTLRRRRFMRPRAGRHVSGEPSRRSAWHVDVVPYLSVDHAGFAVAQMRATWRRVHNGRIPRRVGMHPSREGSGIDPAFIRPVAAIRVLRRKRAAALGIEAGEPRPFPTQGLQNRPRRVVEIILAVVRAVHADPWCADGDVLVAAVDRLRRRRPRRQCPCHCNQEGGRAATSPAAGRPTRAHAAHPQLRLARRVSIRIAASRQLISSTSPSAAGNGILWPSTSTR